MKPYIDTHLHLDQYKNHRTVYESIKHSANYYLCVTNSVEVFISLNHFYREQRNIRFALGVNPTSLNEEIFNPALFEQNLKKTRYVGEVGLDFSPKYVSSQQYQSVVFEQVLASIMGSNKILSIHCNNAEQEVYRLLKKYDLGKQSIIHWFSGNLDECKLLSSLGCYFSLNVNMADKPVFIKLVEIIGLDRILIESDGPHTKMSQSYNEKTIEHIYQRINDILKIHDFEARVFSNFRRLLMG